jgi:hypothetical protein
LEYVKVAKRQKRPRIDKPIIQAPVQDTTPRLAPDAPVKEIGNVLPWMLDFMASVPTKRHIHFSKMDLADGYWRMIVELKAGWNFAS